MGILGAVGAGIGLAASTASRFINMNTFRAWHITNTDTGETIDGDFESNDITREISSNWVQHGSVNQDKPISQYLSGEADSVTFTARLFAGSALDDITPKFEKLSSWVKKDKDLGRPPLVLFYVGDGNPVYGDFFSFIKAISGITYDSPTITGAVRGMTFSISLSEYTEFSLENVPPPETRYARAKEGEYMELLAQREYNDPMLGDVIRNRHPELQLVEAGDTVRLPSKAAIQNEAIAPRSLQLKTILDSKETPQKLLRDFHFDRLNRTYRTTRIPRGL